MHGWSGATGYNRGQVLYRVAEMMQARHDQFADDVVAAEGVSRRKADAIVDAAIDRWVWYAGWTDKLASVLGSVNPVAGPFVNFSTPGADGCGRRCSRRRRRPCSGWSTCWPPCSPPGAPPSWSRRQERPLPADRAGRGARDVGRARRCGQPAHRPRRRAGAVAGRARRRATRSTWPGRPRSRRRRWSEAAADTVKRVLPRPATEPDPTPAPPRATPDGLRDQDGLAPGRAPDRGRLAWLAVASDIVPIQLSLTEGDLVTLWAPTVARGRRGVGGVPRRRRQPLRLHRGHRARGVRPHRTPRTTSSTTRRGRWCRT